MWLKHRPRTPRRRPSPDRGSARTRARRAVPRLPPRIDLDRVKRCSLLSSTLPHGPSQLPEMVPNDGHAPCRLHHGRLVSAAVEAHRRQRARLFGRSSARSSFGSAVVFVVVGGITGIITTNFRRTQTGSRATHAWCLTPDHIHLALAGRPCRQGQRSRSGRGAVFA